jgi:hypothetical protein
MGCWIDGERGRLPYNHSRGDAPMDVIDNGGNGGDGVIGLGRRVLALRRDSRTKREPAGAVGPFSRDRVQVRAGTVELGRTLPQDICTSKQ